MNLPADNLFGLEEGTYPTFLKGWFVMVRRLAPGEHKIYAQDILPDAGKASVTYRLTVGS